MIEMMLDNAYDNTEQLINNWYCQFQYKNPMANTDTDAKIQTMILIFILVKAYIGRWRSCL